MKEMALEELPGDAAAKLAAAQTERILLTRKGQPVALVVGLENKDQEDFQLESSEEFWRMIEQRRKEATVSWDSVKSEILAAED